MIECEFFGTDALVPDELKIYCALFDVYCVNVVRPHRSYCPSDGLPRRKPRTATCGIACNCPMPEAWLTEANGAGQNLVVFQN